LAERVKHSSLFCLIVNNDLDGTDIWGQLKNFFPHNLQRGHRSKSVYPWHDLDRRLAYPSRAPFSHFL